MIEYGIHDHYLDVTAKAKKYYVHHNSLIIPAGPKNFNSYFTDPCPGVIKILRITMGTTIYNIQEDDLQEHIISIPNPLLIDLEFIYKIRDLVSNFDSHYMDLIIFNDDPTIETSIVMATHNRSKQTYYTLETIERNTTKGVQVIIVDDSTTDPMDCFILKRFKINIWYIRIKNKFWINPCVSYNLGFKCAKGNNIIIQNSEVAHIGDIISMTQNMLTDQNYLVFDVCGLSNSNSDLILRTIPSNYDTIYNTYNKEWTWYQNSTICNTSYHFLTALTRSTLDLMHGMDYDFSMGLWYDDQEWIWRLKILGIVIVNIQHQNHKVLGCHQWHSHEVHSIHTNKELFETKQQYYQTHGIFFQTTDHSPETLQEIIY
jgi:glycosyltransferase involved in cell wall biosynthesis